MNLLFDTVIAGFGLAGACAARVISERESVLLLEASAPGAGASGIYAGLVSPLMARRARAVWRINDAVNVLDRTRWRRSASRFRVTTDEDTFARACPESPFRKSTGFLTIIIARKTVILARYVMGTPVQSCRCQKY